MDIQTEITRITAEIERYKELEKQSHAQWVDLSNTPRKLKTQSGKVDKLLENLKGDELKMT